MVGKLKRCMGVLYQQAEGFGFRLYVYGWRHAGFAALEFFCFFFLRRGGVIPTAFAVTVKMYSTLCNISPPPCVCAKRLVVLERVFLCFFFSYRAMSVSVTRIVVLPARRTMCVFLNPPRTVPPFWYIQLLISSIGF